MKLRRQSIDVLVKTIPNVGTSDFVATLHFSFKKPVSEKQLTAAILRAVNTKEFALAGQCTVVTVLPAASAIQGPR